MPIRIEHGKPETLLTAAQMKGEARKQEELQKMQMEFDYRQALRQQDMAIDLQAEERAKQWEIEKMQLRSQIDFAREEQLRQRKLDSIDSAIQQIDKEVLAGRITEQEAYPIKQKLELGKMGVNVPVSAFPGDEEDRFGVAPHWMRGREAPAGTPERMLYEAEMKRRIEGRAGTIPYHLSPEFLRTLPPSTAQDMLADKGIFFDSDEEFEAWLVNLESAEPTELPLGDKTLGVGVRAEGAVEGQVTVVSPAGIEGTIPIEDLEEALAEGYQVIQSKQPELVFRGYGETEQPKETKPPELIFKGFDPKRDIRPPSFRKFLRFFSKP